MVTGVVTAVMMVATAEVATTVVASEVTATAVPAAVHAPMKPQRAAGQAGYGITERASRSALAHQASWSSRVLAYFGASASSGRPSCQVVK